VAFFNGLPSQIMRVAPFPILAALLVGCATTSDPVDRLVAKLSSSHGLWRNGEFAILGLPATASTEQVVARVFQMDGFEPSQVAKHRILKVRKVRIPGDDPDIYTAVVIDTDFGRKIVLLKYQGPAAGWWSRIYDADTSA